MFMAQVTLSVRMDEEIKRMFDEFCAEVGMDTSVAVNIFARTVVREHRIPFEIAASTDPFYNPVNQAVLRRSIAQLDAGQGIRHELIEETDDA